MHFGNYVYIVPFLEPSHLLNLSHLSLEVPSPHPSSSHACKGVEPSHQRGALPGPLSRLLRGLGGWLGGLRSGGTGGGRT